MNRLLIARRGGFGDNRKRLRFVCHPELVEGSLSDGHVVEPVEVLKKFLKTSPMMAYLAPTP